MDIEKPVAIRTSRIHYPHSFHGIFIEPSGLTVPSQLRRWKNPPTNQFCCGVFQCECRGETMPKVTWVHLLCLYFISLVNPMGNLISKHEHYWETLFRSITSCQIIRLHKEKINFWLENISRHISTACVKCNNCTLMHCYLMLKTQCLLLTFWKTCEACNWMFTNIFFIR